MHATQPRDLARITRTLCVGFGAMAVALGAVAPLQAAGQEARPDFSGVYRAYRGPGAGGGGDQELPLTEVAQARVDEIELLLEGTGETSGGWCLGYGMPSSMMSSGGYPMEIIQRPEQITVIYEAHNELRRIYISEDKRMPPSDRFPDRNGYSEGRWEGDTLVVETTQLKEQADARHPHSTEMKVVERYHQETGPDGEQLLVADVTLTDPEWYTRPVELEKRWVLDPDGVMLPYECNEPAWNQRLEELRQQKLDN